MKASVWREIGRLELEDIPVPEINEDEVLLKVLAAGVCITDLHVYKGLFTYSKPPLVLGHEIAGEVVKTGKHAEGIRIGDRVVVETSMGCGKCEHCQSGNRQICPDMHEIGFTPGYGGYAEYAKAPAKNTIPVPPQLSNEEAAITESVVCPSGALYRLGIRMGETVLVYGVGPAGLAFIQTAKAMGAGRIIAVARNVYRLKQAERFGADVTVSSLTEDPVKRVLEMTKGLGADTVCEAAGASETIESAFYTVKNGGRIILYGIPSDSEKICFPVSSIITRQLEIYGAVGNPFVWKPLLEMAAKGAINLRDMVTHRFSLDQIEEAFKLLEERDEKLIKAVIIP